MDVSSEEWAALVHEYQEAERVWDEAFDAYNLLEPQESGDTPEERRYEAARDVAYRLEDRLLAMRPPNAEAALYQLRLFGIRHHDVDVDDDPMDSEDPLEGGVVRRVHAALSAALAGERGAAQG